MTDAEKLEAIEQFLEPVRHYTKPGASVPQNSKVFVQILGALTSVAEVFGEPMVAVKVSELEELRAFKAARTPVRK